MGHQIREQVVASSNKSKTFTSRYSSSLSVAATFKQHRNLERKGGSTFHPFLAVLSSKPVHHRIIEWSGLKRTLKIIATGLRKKVGEIENIISYHLYPEEFLQITHKKKSPTTNSLFVRQRDEVL